MWIDEDCKIDERRLKKKSKEILLILWIGSKDFIKKVVTSDDWPRMVLAGREAFRYPSLFLSFYQRGYTPPPSRID